MIDIRKDFPNLEEKNRGKTLVYLDSAATSLTPKQVINSESEYYEKFGGSIHRSVYELGEKATNAFENSRKRIADFIGASKNSWVRFRVGGQKHALLGFFVKNIFEKY